VAAVFVVATGWLLSSSVLGGKVLSPKDMMWFEPPFSAVRPPELTRPANPHLTAPAYIFEPGLLQARQAVRSGRLPVWDANLAAGRPLLAAQQPGVLYPVNWLAYLLSFWSSLAWIAAAKLLIAAAGTFFLCRGRRLSVPASTLAGLAFAFSAGYVAWLLYPNTNVLALLPWSLFLTHRLAARGRSRDVLLLALVLGLAVLAGHPESFFILLVGTVAYWGFCTWSERRHSGDSDWQPRRRAGMLVAALVLGAGIGAVMALPFFEIWAQSYHSARGLAPPYSPRILAGFSWPEFWGRPDKVAFDGPGLNYASRSVYIGAAPLVLAVAGLAVRRSAGQLFFAGVAAVSLLMVLHVPVLSGLIRDLPGASLIHLPWFLWLVMLSGAVLAAYGLDIALAATPLERRRMLIVAGGIVAVPVLLYLATTPALGVWRDALREQPVLSTSPPSSDVAGLASVLRWTGLAIATLALLALIAKRPAQRRLAAGLVLALTVADLVSLSRGYNPAIPKAIAAPPPPASVAYLQRAHSSGRISAPEGGLFPKLAVQFGLRDMRSQDLPELERYSRLFQRLGGAVARFSGASSYRAAEPHSNKLLDVFGADRILTGNQRPARLTRGFRLLFDRPGQRVFANPSALPRAWMAYSWRTVAGIDQALDRTAGSSRTRLLQAPVIEGARQPGSGAAPRASLARITADRSTEVAVEVDARRPGYLVLDDTYYPGWGAKVDGRDASILPANSAFRAVRLDKGHHLVRFTYRPLTVVLGAILTLIALAVTALGLLVPLVRTRWARSKRG
jgi:hypothetical protein